ncbi:MAG TPA: FtsQ-type POTRA domain-containing protein [Terriglobales bacterium]|nr:FtsQ-type POTRA domain-containing protein [Terriglobales bacterium]
MARKESPTILQEELYPPGAENSRSESSRAYSRNDGSHPSSHESLDDARMMDLDVAEESPFLRGQKRVSARRSALPKKTASRLLWTAVAASILCVVALLAAGVYRYGERSWRFRVESSDNIEITGMQNATKAQIMEVMGADIGRNIFFVPLTQQKAQLEQIPWVESASVMRFVPNRLKVEIHERTPVAFARVGPRIFLIDAGGTLMELPHNHKYSFPVVLGMNPGEPLSTRAPRMKAYNELVEELDSGGAHYSQDLSEVDLSDLDDLKVRVNDPAGDVLVELGSSDYLKRYKTYISHVQEWRQQFQKLESVNLRYDNQVIVNPDLEGKPKQAALTPAVAKAAVAAGVKPAALVTKFSASPRGLPKPAFELSKSTLESAEGKKPAAKLRLKKNSSVHARTAQAKPAQKKLQKPGARSAAKTTPKLMAKFSAGPVTSSAGAKKSDGRRAMRSVPAAVGASPKPTPAIAKPSAGVN